MGMPPCRGAIQWRKQCRNLFCRWAVRRPADYFGRLDGFTRGYLTAAFWTAIDECENATLNELSPKARHQLHEDCTQFNMLADAWLHKAYLRGDMSYDMEQAGTDFWLTRNRHGAGYWDRGLGKPATS
jgi:hypothetical protein